MLLCVAVQAGASCIHGTLVSDDGKPIAGAVVTLYAPEADGERAARLEKVAQRVPVNQGKSNERGWFLVDPKRRGDFDVVVLADGYSPQLLHASAGKNLGTIKLASARQVTVSVACDTKPLVGANIVMLESDGIELAAKTDQAGHFHVPQPTTDVRVLVGGREVARKVADGMTIAACR